MYSMSKPCFINDFIFSVAAFCPTSMSIDMTQQIWLGRQWWVIQTCDPICLFGFFRCSCQKQISSHYKDSIFRHLNNECSTTLWLLQFVTIIFIMLATTINTM
ncbi:hypothetical protein ES332_D05G267600v1 [Gossypium tomentosum]|uniref:Uncharacterized protein n=1 Tax=Gossypium tomentosum TaxID=34277 RepID=A0A5D2L0Q8_GOSTO|nr:hypothetical protein ES332_D05G267600v1 [Gossypium tomentosum]TYH72626.1 hypothetical protein ES332_D05G267600v1 [Gossypium tomentosum]TYH72627.1 hypothetical protein ES332_D05G267600v1 [Gossypium tomentosum]